MSFRDRIDDFRDDLDAWLDERESWIPRAVLLAYLTYGFVRHLADPLYKTWFGSITLAFHEIGHIVFMPLGHTLMTAGGSIMQLAVPLAAAIYFAQEAARLVRIRRGPRMAPRA
jgi:hypothetical protein